MLRIEVEGNEFYDETTESFIQVKPQTLQLEHSLVSLSKWESKWIKPFLTDKDKTQEETLDYIRCMTLTQNVNPLVYNCISTKNWNDILEYIDAPMTATWFNERKKINHGREVITSEIIYYWMISMNIPFECQKWHLNRLLTLIKVCNIKNSPPQKMSKADVARQYRELNEKRRAQLNTRG